jgi:hypothetical protein
VVNNGRTKHIYLLTTVYKANFETFLTICNSFLPIVNYFVVIDEHSNMAIIHYVLIHEDSYHKQDHRLQHQG